MALDKRYGGAYHYIVACVPCGKPRKRPNGCCSTNIQRASSYSACSWSPIARITTWPTNSEQGAWFLGSPGAWFDDHSYRVILELVPLTGTLGHLLSSPARRIARSLVGLPPDGAKEAQSVFTPNSHKQGIRREREKAKSCREFNLN